MPHKAAAYDLSKHLDPAIRDQLLDPETPNDVVDVARALAESHTPSWLYYYLIEVTAPADTGTLLVEFLDDDTIHETARRYAETDGPIINLAHPGEYNQTRADPLEPSREAYEAKRAEITTALADAYQRIIGDDLPYFNDDDFVAWLADGMVDNMNLFQWAVYEQTAADRGADTPTTTVAEWHVQRTYSHQLIDAVATYESRDPETDISYEAVRQQYQTEFGGYTDHFVDATDENEEDATDIPLLAPPMPSS